MNLVRKFYLLYKYRIYPSISEIRGSHFVLRNLQDFLLRNEPKTSESPSNVFEKGDWDNLILLDACRHDVFEDVFGESDYRISLGSATPEFIRKTFSEGYFSDVVYVTGNPHFYGDVFENITGRLPDEVFHAVYNTYETDWDENEGVVLSEPLLRDAMNARKMFPEKKIIVHFMQPHVPFVKSEFEQSPNNPAGEGSSIEVDKNPLSETQKAELGKIEPSLVKKNYRKNLEYVKSFVKNLSEDLEGKTVVTSDHGELLGEQGIWGHPAGRSEKELRIVPWYKIGD